MQITSAIEAALLAAVTRAIETVGLPAFKRTSLFGSNDRK